MGQGRGADDSSRDQALFLRREMRSVLATHGFYTEILSTVVGPEGRVYAHNNDFVATRFGEGLDQRLDKLREAGRDNVEPIVAEMDEMELPPDLDVVLLIRFYQVQHVPRPGQTRLPLSSRPGVFGRFAPEPVPLD